MKNSVRSLLLTVAAAAAGLACASAVANPRAQPEPQLQYAKPVTDPAEIGTWVRQLVGRYRFEGMVQVVYAPRGVPAYPCVTEEGRPQDYCTGVKGKGDCVAVGKGPGVQCVLNVAWQDIYEIIQPGEQASTDPVGVFNLPGGVSYLDPAMMLYGIDPGKAALSYLLVDNKGLPEGGTGAIAGTRAVFRVPCVNAPALFSAMKPAPRDREEGSPRSCERIMRIDAKPDARLLYMSVDTEINGEIWTRHDFSMYRDDPAPDTAGANPAPAR